eukprot:NODE_20753_length_783_cov_5.057927.p5 GENE.NODE_20753_length_783_cov_5.057927~~NODE_20753_length_783_cov_5.057927.p5  ORF type:complete len:59 (-),score=13.38 NODE_20753_length_783_cov_5.057927:293-469(-)
MFKPGEAHDDDYRARRSSEADLDSSSVKEGIVEEVEAVVARSSSSSYGDRRHQLREGR